MPGCGAERPVDELPHQGNIGLIGLGSANFRAQAASLQGTKPNLMIDLHCLSQGNINLIKAAAAKGVKRFVLVTSIGTGDSAGAPPKPVFDVLEKVLVEKAKAEDYLRVSASAGHPDLRPSQSHALCLDCSPHLLLLRLSTRSPCTM